ncbi:hypothetical protein CPB86DRAFT_782244 [Serendipita vermifera]|nr:hypothetical protein CPB86DRAFT_782244 [Serendipita vermifera]
MAAPFPALEGYYQVVFLHVEPVMMIFPALLLWFIPGALWFHNELIPGVEPATSLDPRAQMVIWQLANCFALLGLISSFVLRAIRDALPSDPVAQERIIGACLTALAIADVTHILATVFAMPEEVLLSPSLWNATVIGNIHFTAFLFASRVAWFLGIGRNTYYYSVRSGPEQEEDVKAE